MVDYPLRVSPEYRDVADASDGVIRQSPQEEVCFNINKTGDFAESVFWTTAAAERPHIEASLPENRQSPASNTGPARVITDYQCQFE
jgi:hypothetical protein